MAATIAAETAVRRNARPGRAVPGCVAPRPWVVPGGVSRPRDGTATDGGPAVIGSGRCRRAAATAGQPPPARYGVPLAGRRDLVGPGRGSGAARPAGRGQAS